MTTMLDKAAESLCARTEGRDDVWPDLTAGERDGYKDLARAALQAIKGEDEYLDRVVSRVAWHSGSGQKAQNVRTAMIDAILNEKTT